MCGVVESLLTGLQAWALFAPLMEHIFSAMASTGRSLFSDNVSREGVRRYCIDGEIEFHLGSSSASRHCGIGGYAESMSAGRRVIHFDMSGKEDGKSLVCD